MMEESGRKETYRFLRWSLLAAVLLVVIGFCLYGAAGRDDAHITYWPAYTLAHMGEILNYNGKMLEQSSSLLQVVLLALSHVVSGENIVTLGHLMSIFFGAASLPLTYVFARRLNREAGALAALTTAVYGSFIYWSFGGLESTLAAFCVLWILLSFDEILSSSGSSGWQWGNALLATLALLAVRPEMPIVIGCILAGTSVILVWRGVPFDITKRLGYLALLSALVTTAFFAWRYSTFGHFFPLSVSAKSGVSLERAYQGIRYLGSQVRGPSILGFGLTPMGFFGSIAVVATTSYLFRRFSKGNTEPTTHLGSLGGSFALAYLSFIVLTGGDWMEAGRFTVPLVPVAAAFISVEIYSYFQNRKIQLVLSTIVFAIALASAVNVATYESTGILITSRDNFEKENLSSLKDKDRFSFFELYNKIHFRDVLLLDKFHDAFKKVERVKNSKVYVVSAYAGFTPYHLSRREFGKLEYIDKFGLTTTQLVNCSSIKSKNKRKIEGIFFSFEDILDDINKKECKYEVDVIFTSSGIKKLEKMGYKEVYINRKKESSYNIGKMSVYVNKSYKYLFD